MSKLRTQSNVVTVATNNVSRRTRIIFVCFIEKRPVTSCNHIMVVQKRNREVLEEELWNFQRKVVIGGMGNYK